MPRDAPQSGARIVFKFIDGKWRETVPLGNGKYKQVRTASGTYDFVLQEGELRAVKRSRTKEAELAAADMPRPGHTEAAHGERVTWAGQVKFNKNSGQVSEWTDLTGHYLSASSMKDEVVKAGFPETKFNQHPEVTAARQGSRPKQGPQLPVYQPPTRSRTGEGAKIKPGPPRTADLDAHYPSKKTTPPTEPTVSPATSSTQPPTAKTPAAPPAEIPPSSTRATPTVELPPVRTQPPSSEPSVTTAPTEPVIRSGAAAPSAEIVPELNVRSVLGGIGSALAMFLIGHFLGGYTQRAIQDMVNDDMKALEPDIRELMKKELERVGAKNWVRQKLRPPIYMNVTLDVWRWGVFEAELFNYDWGIPSVSIVNVTASVMPWSWTYPYPEGWDGNFERTGLGMMTEHNYVTYTIPPDRLFAP